MHARKHSKPVILAALLLGFGLSAVPAMAIQSTGAKKEAPSAPSDFRKFDINGDGYLSLDEWKAQGLEERAFTQADANKDSRLSQDEYVKARAINDRIHVGEYADDAWITTKVKALLLKDSMLNGMKIGVETQDQMVQLSGKVKNAGQVSRAVKIASGVEGVKGVHNDLRVKQ